MKHLEHCDALELEITTFVDVLSSADQAVNVPSCPGWTAKDVAEHLGLIHRWATSLVERRAPARISFAELGLTSADATPQWLQEGGHDLVVALRACDPDASMWAWGPDQHARFWSRRQLHETLVHRMDLELAVGRVPRAPAVVAIDAIDEFLVNLGSAQRFSPKVKELRGRGERVGFRVLDGDARWTVTLLDDRFVVADDDDGDVDAELSGGAIDLLLTLYRRTPLAVADVRVEGEKALVDYWIDHSALE